MDLVVTYFESLDNTSNASLYDLSLAPFPLHQAYSFYILRPFINHMSAEMSYVASQLTQLPAATGTESLLMEFYAGKQSALGRKGWRRFVPCAPKAEEEESSDDDSEEEEEEDDGKKGGGKGKPMKVSSGRRR